MQGQSANKRETQSARSTQQKKARRLKPQQHGVIEQNVAGHAEPRDLSQFICLQDKG